MRPDDREALCSTESPASTEVRKMKALARLERHLVWTALLYCACAQSSAAPQDPSTGEAGTSTDSSGSSTIGDDGSAGDSTTGTGDADTGLDDSSSTGADPELQPHDDVKYTRQDRPLEAASADGVLSNDTAPDGGPLDVIAFDSESIHGGALALMPDGAFAYVPAPGFWGSDSFEYTVSDGVEMASATLTIWVAPAVVPIEDISEGRGGYSLSSAPAGTDSSPAVHAAGDVNGDGLGDVLIGLSLEGTPDDAGRTYVAFGKADTAAVDLAAVAAGDGGFVIDGAVENEHSGFSISGGGDVNGDGLDDILVSSFRTNVLGQGSRGYVVFGKAGGDPVDLADITSGVGGFVIRGRSQVGPQRCATLAAGGDIGGDGLDDVLVDDCLGDASDGNHRIYVVHGRESTTPIDLADIEDESGGFVVGDIVGSYPENRNLRGAGDIDGDGLDDIVFGMPGESPNGTSSGRTYVVLGKADNATVSLVEVGEGIGGFTIDGAQRGEMSGFAVDGAGDVDGDGLDDLVIGTLVDDSAPTSGYGRAYIVYGRADDASVALADVAAGDGGRRLSGAAQYDGAGLSVAGLGDVDGDGLDDVIVGAVPIGDPPALEGRAYVVYGTDATAALDLGSLASDGGGFEIVGDSWYFARFVEAAGDVDDDGLSDIVIGQVPFSAEPDKSWIVLGVPTDPIE